MGGVSPIMSAIMHDVEPPWPVNEPDRLERLKSYCVLDSQPDPRFDELTRLASRHFGVPMALVSLVDEARQWFLSRHGLAAAATARRVAFCAYTILEDRVMVVPDALADERFATNPLVTDGPRIRFYAGAPLRAPDGALLGTFCVLDRVARPDFDAEAVRDLEAFARLVMLEFEARAERAAAKREEAHRRAIVEAAADAMIVIGEDGIIRSVNPAVRRLFGYEAEELVGQPVGVLMPEPERSQHAAYQRAYLETGTRKIIGVGRTLEGVRKDGTRVPLDVSIAEWAADGERCFTGILRDATERQEAESQLRASQALIASVLESAPDPIFAKDREGRYILANAACEKALGHPGAVIGHGDRHFFPAEVAERLVAADQRVMATGQAVTLEEALTCPATGETRFYVISKVPLRGDDGTITGLAGVARDITAAKRAEEALRNSEARLRSLVENAAQIMWLARPDGSIEFANEAWRQFTGSSLTERTRWEALHPDDAKRIYEIRTRSIAAGEMYGGEVRIRGVDGAWRWHLVRVVPLCEGQRVIAWVGTATDVHELQRAREAAEAADRTKGRFLAAASHDLRQPLQSIMLFAEALRPHVTGEAGQGKMAHLMRGLDILQGLLNELLEVSRLDAGLVKPAIGEFDLSGLLSRLSDVYAPLAAEKGIAWQVTGCAVCARTDRALLEQMLRNLIENAIRFTNAGQVSIACRTEGARVWVDVKDTGIGIPEDQQGNVFEDLQQLGNPERDRNQGLGLGLGVVRRLSRMLDHPVVVSSIPGKGSRFSLAVPVVEVPQKGALPPALGAESDNKAPFVVAVDDDPIVLMGIVAMLRQWKCDPLGASSTDEALEQLRRDGRRPDVMLVDYRLREGRTGTEAVLKVRELHDDTVPAVIITGEIGPEPQRDAAEHGLDLLHKPVTPRLLRSVLQRWVRVMAT